MGSVLLDPHGPRRPRRPAGLESLERTRQAIDPEPLDVHPLVALTATWGAQITSSSFTALWQAKARRLSHPAAMIRVPWVTGPGTSGELRVVLTGPGSATSSHLALATNSSSIDVLGWQHALDLWEAGATPLTVSVEARRSAGADNVNIFLPQIALIDPRGTTFSDELNAAEDGGTWTIGGWMPGW